MKTFSYLWLSRWILRITRNVSSKTYRENQHTHFMISNFFFRKPCRLWDNVEKYGKAREATDDDTIWCVRFACWISKTTRAHAHAHAYAPGHPHARMSARIHRQVRNTSCFYTATMVPWTRLNVMLYAHCLCYWDLLTHYLCIFVRIW
jgi:hypothetical protein